MTRTLILAIAATAALSGAAFAGPSVQDKFVAHAIESNERANAAAITDGTGAVTTFSSGGSISALDVALKDAIENDDRQKARFLRAQIDAAEAGDATSFSTRGSSTAALEIALKDAIENDDRQKANHIRAQLSR